MLRLGWTLAGSPAQGFQHLVLKHATLIIYPCARSVVILDASTLTLARVLPFWEVFPATWHAEHHVHCLSVDSGMKLIVASMNNQIATWSLSGVQDDAWRAHSSLTLPEDSTVTTLDCKSGLLAVGSQGSLSVYTMIMDDDLPTWSQKWTLAVTTPSLGRFAPSLMFIATISPNDRNVRIYSTTLGCQTQVIPHPRPVVSICWRHSQASSRDDLILYTITSDSTLRIFLPVLDSPQYLQLHASLDAFSALSVSITPNVSVPRSSVFWLDREVIGTSLKKILKDRAEMEDGPTKRLKEIDDEGWDLFLRVFADGSIVVTAVANIDRRPPTLLRQFVLIQSPPSSLPVVPEHLYLLPKPNSATVTLIVSPPLMSFDLEPLSFFDSQPKGLKPRTNGVERVPEEECDIVKFVRTPEGKAVGVMRTKGGEIWRVAHHETRCVRAARWPSADLVVVLARGRRFVTYSAADSTLTLHSNNAPATLSVPKVDSLFSFPRKDDESIVGITPDLTLLHVLVHELPTPSLELCSQIRLPSVAAAKAILPVDPMAWSGSGSWIEHDVLLSVSKDGELAFWLPEETDKLHWRCTGTVRTGRTGFTKAVCSSAKKSALVVPSPDGQELTIWDSKESQFSSGLEYSSCFSEPINDLDWTSTPDNQSILAVGFAQEVKILAQQRKTYFDDEPNWAVVWKVQIGSFTPYTISDSIWLSHGSLLVGAGHQMFLYGQSQTDPNTETLFEYVARHNGPLPDYHPQMLLQCLLWEKVEQVKTIIVNLARAVEEMQTTNELIWHPIPVEEFWQKDHMPTSVPRQRKRYTFLFDAPTPKEEPEEEGFGRPLVEKVLETLEWKPIPHLTPNENAHLLVLIQTTLDIDEQRRALDAHGLRYLISMRSFHILNQRASEPSSRASNGLIPRPTGRRERLRYRDMIWAFFSESQDILLDAGVRACNGKMCWSDARALGISVWLNSVESLRAQLETIARNEYMAGDNRDPTACTLFYFALGKVKLVHGLWRQAAWHKEQALMLKFLANDFNEPRWKTAALKNAYVLLSKQRFEYAAAFFLLGGRLKDAVDVCIKQLSDFQLAIAISRAVEQSNEGPVFLDILENTVLPIAFKGGNRWLASWAFWLLRRRDLAVRVLLTPLKDVSDILNVRIEDIGDSNYDDPSLALLFSVLRSKTLQAAQGTSEISGRTEFNFVLQIARVFCRMGCHVLALDLVRSWSFERPSMPILSDMEKADAVHFELPIIPPSPTLRRPMFAIQLHRRKRSTMTIDLDIPSEPPTRKGSPEPGEGRPAITSPLTPDVIKEESDLFARKAGIGSLMKTAKQDVKVPEFNMDTFF